MSHVTIEPANKSQSMLRVLGLCTPLPTATRYITAYQNHTHTSTTSPPPSRHPGAPRAFHATTAEIGLHTHVTQPAVVRHVELVAVVCRAASMCGATAEPDHRTAVHRVVTHTEEQMAQQHTVDTIVPHTRTVRECLERADPHVARDQHVLFMVEVQLAERQVRTRRRQVHFESARTRPTTRRPDTTQPRR